MFQDDNVQPPTPPRSSPVRQESRNVSSSPATQQCNSLPPAQWHRSHSSSLNLMLSPPSQVQRTPPHPVLERHATLSPIHGPLTASVHLNIPRAEDNPQRHQPIQPMNVIASSSQVFGHQAPPPLVATSTSRTKGKKNCSCQEAKEEELVKVPLNHVRCFAPCHSGTSIALSSVASLCGSLVLNCTLIDLLWTFNIILHTISNCV